MDINTIKNNIYLMFSKKENFYKEGFYDSSYLYCFNYLFDSNQLESYKNIIKTFKIAINKNVLKNVDILNSILLYFIKKILLLKELNDTYIRNEKDYYKYIFYHDYIHTLIQNKKIQVFQFSNFDDLINKGISEINFPMRNISIFPNVLIIGYKNDFYIRKKIAREILEYYFSKLNYFYSDTLGNFCLFAFPVKNVLYLDVLQHKKEDYIQINFNYYISDDSIKLFEFKEKESGVFKRWIEKSIL